jgi:hypothetical protein
LPGSSCAECDNAGGGGGGGGVGSASGSGSAITSSRQVAETDLYRVDGNTLYYLDGYRGLMVFDITNPDGPRLVGRSPIFGSPIDMYVSNGIAVVVIADWYDINSDGTPFYGSIVRGLDATDPTDIKVLGDARLQGSVTDDRVVGNVLYLVAENWGYDDYGWGGGYAVDRGAGGAVARSRAERSGKTTTPTDTVIVSSVSFANNQIQLVSNVTFPAYGGVFNVTPSSILFANPTSNNQGQSELVYLDISDPGGAIRQRGSIVVDGAIQGWGADNGRWNLDFADGVTAHSIGMSYDNNDDYVLAIADFTNPDAPVLDSELTIPSPGWDVAALFQPGRMYLSPQYWYSSEPTPFQVYDVTTPTKPVLAGTVNISGSVWNILPAPSNRLFALGNSYNSDSSAVSLQYIDATNPAAPALLSAQQFGNGWAWTPAAGTFKAFTMNTTQGLVVVPYAGWDSNSGAYNNGVQLVQFTAQNATVVGAAHTKGWVERGIFVGTRLYSLADMALAVIDYSNPNAPRVVTELTLARNVFTAQPVGATIGEVSSDWWGNDNTTSEVRVLPIAQADETTDGVQVSDLTLPGVGPQVFNNGTLEYIVTYVPVPITCGYSAETGCQANIEQVTVVDLSNGGAKIRGTIQLPQDPWQWGGWGWWGFYWWDWFGGDQVVQVQNNALALRRWEPQYDSNGDYVGALSDLFIVDLSNPDAPSLASTTITTDPNGWWGNMQVVGDTLYTTHEEWEQRANSNFGGYVRYYADRIDLSDRSHPNVEHSLNIPGLIVGGDASDPSIVYTIDYRWDGNNWRNDFDVVSLGRTHATLEATLRLDGWAGSTFVSGTTAYMSTNVYDPNDSNPPIIKLHAIDVSNPHDPVDRVASGPNGWGWLLGVEGDRALVSSGWTGAGIDIYQLKPDAPPVFQQTVRTNGWWPNGISRQNNQLFISSGYWGVQTVNLN